MSVPSHFKIEPVFFKNRPALRKLLWALAVLLPGASAVFLGFVADSMIDRPPTGQIAELGLRLEGARAGDLGTYAAGELDQIQAALDAALTSIDVESRKEWRLQTYERSWSLVEGAEQIFANVEERFGQQTAN